MGGFQKFPIPRYLQVTKLNNYRVMNGLLTEDGDYIY